MFEFANNPYYILGHALVVLLLLVVIVRLVNNITLLKINNESMRNRAMSYSSGATQRFMQDPSATDQRSYATGYNFQELNTLPRPEEPQGMDARDMSNAAVSEGFTGDFLNQEEVLAAQLYNEGFTSISPEQQVASELAIGRGFTA